MTAIYPLDCFVILLTTQLVAAWVLNNMGYYILITLLADVVFRKIVRNRG
jgi:hypothetical protein